MSLNKLMLIGHVGKDPDIRILEAGSKVVTFSFATTEKGYTLANGTQVPERTVVEKYVHKGDKLYLEGKIRTRSYDDSRGIKRYITELFVDNMEMLSVKPQQAPPPPPLPEHTNNQTRSAVNECPPPLPPTKDDLPF